MTSQLPGTWHEPHREVLFPPYEAQRLWTEQAIPKLESVASTYGGYITYGDLGDHLFETTKVRTTNLLPRWIRFTLHNVLDYCDERNLPATTALVVQKESGRVGPGFNAWLQLQNRRPIDNVDELEAVAAQERLASYRLYCPDVPDNAVPMPTPQLGKRINSGDVEWPWAAPPCASCGGPLKFYEPCRVCN
ncbi:hypothetical protein [Kocuria oceani]|uniref:Uncharacterized protein n=1 Tax=Kocuria oceani TaxID=988827 RepID=A0ABV9TKY6_9MICC|nr:hypothetical protein [Kocuria oceani]